MVDLIKILGNGDVKYYPATSQSVSEIITNSGKIIVLQINDENSSISIVAPTASSVTPMHVRAGRLPGIK